MLLVVSSRPVLLAASTSTVSCVPTGSPCTLILYSDGMSYRSDGSGNIDTVNDGVMQFRNVTDSYGNKNS